MNDKLNYIPRGITQTKPFFMFLKVIMIVIGSLALAAICFAIFVIVLNSNSILDTIFGWEPAVLLLLFLFVIIIVFAVILFYFLISALYFFGFIISAVCCIVSGILIGKAGKVEKGRNALARNKHVGLFVTSFILNNCAIAFCVLTYFIINTLSGSFSSNFSDPDFIFIYSIVLVCFAIFILLINIFEIIYFALNIKTANKIIRLDLEEDLLLKQQKNAVNANPAVDASLFYSGNTPPQNNYYPQQQNQPQNNYYSQQQSQPQNNDIKIESEIDKINPFNNSTDNKDNNQ